MGKEKFFASSRNIYKVSIGVVLTFVWIFLLFNSSQFVPSESADFWTIVILSYTVMLALVLGSSDARSRLFDVPSIKFIPRFLLFFLPSMLLFGFLFGTIGSTSGGLLEILRVLPVWLLVIHTVMFVIIESSVQVWAEENTALGRIGTSFAFGALHIYVWLGPALLNFILASLLFLFFSWVNWQFRNSRSDLAPISGVHGGYNGGQLIMV